MGLNKETSLPASSLNDEQQNKDMLPKGDSMNTESGVVVVVHKSPCKKKWKGKSEKDWKKLTLKLVGCDTYLIYTCCAVHAFLSLYTNYKHITFIYTIYMHTLLCPICTHSISCVDTEYPSSECNEEETNVTQSSLL